MNSGFFIDPGQLLKIYLALIALSILDEENSWINQS